MYVITGGAGFIGSIVCAGLDDRGDDVVVVDRLGRGDKWRNIAKRRLIDLVPPEELFAWLEPAGHRITAVIHMGAISTTTETDADLIAATNFRLSCRLWDWCAAAEVPLIYASSAATYGDGSAGFDDDVTPATLADLRPLNAYGWSKHLFDRWVMARVHGGGPAPPRWLGLKFFNVFGPNETHKGSQRSVAHQLHEQITAGGRARLFKSDHPDYPDGGQSRDFVWVGDCADVMLWWLGSPGAPSGLFNLGSGVSRSFADLARAVFASLGREPKIDFIDMPANLRGKYQYYTRAPMGRLAEAGYNRPPTDLETAVGLYVRRLTSDDPYC